MYTIYSVHYCDTHNNSNTNSNFYDDKYTASDTNNNSDSNNNHNAFAVFNTYGNAHYK